MNTTEINRKLALAIGYPLKDIKQTKGDTVVVQTYNFMNKIKLGSRWAYGYRVFSHLDVETIWPIAAKYKAFPAVSLSGIWWAEANGLKRVGFGESQVPQTAIALAVIDGAGL